MRGVGGGVDVGVDVGVCVVDAMRKHSCDAASEASRNVECNRKGATPV